MSSGWITKTFDMVGICTDCCVIVIIIVPISECAGNMSQCDILKQNEKTEHKFDTLFHYNNPIIIHLTVFGFISLSVESQNKNIFT